MGLTPINASSYDLSLPVWMHSNEAQDRIHVMPIITPVFPAQNATANVTQSTLAVMKLELERGREICKKINDGNTNWEELFEDNNVFDKYTMFLQVSAIAPAQVPVDKWNRNSETCASTVYYDMWKGFCNAHIHHLVTWLEMWPNAYAELVHPFQRNFKRPRTDDENAPHEHLWYCGLKFNHAKMQSDGKKVPDLNFPVSHFRKRLMDWENRKDGMELRITAPKRKDLPEFVLSPKDNDEETAVIPGRRAGMPRTCEDCQIVQEYQTSDGYKCANPYQFVHSKMCCICYTNKYGNLQSAWCGHCVARWGHQEELETALLQEEPDVTGMNSPSRFDDPRALLEKINTIRELVGAALQQRCNLLTASRLLQTSDGVQLFVGRFKEIFKDDKLDLSIYSNSDEGKKPGKNLRASLPNPFCLQLLNLVHTPFFRSALAQLNGILTALDLSGHPYLERLPVEELLAIKSLTILECRGCPVVISALLQTPEGVDNLIAPIKRVGSNHGTLDLAHDLEHGSRRPVFRDKLDGRQRPLFFEGKLDFNVEGTLMKGARHEDMVNLFKMPNFSKGLVQLDGMLTGLDVSGHPHLERLPVKNLITIKSLKTLKCRGCPMATSALLQTPEGVDHLISLIKRVGSNNGKLDLSHDLKYGSQRPVFFDGKLDLSTEGTLMKGARREDMVNLFEMPNFSTGLVQLDGMLKALDVSGHSHLERLPVEVLITIRLLGNLDYRNCPRLFPPPPEIAKLGGEQTMTYLRLADPKNGGKANKKIELILIGRGESGKTSLKDALIKGKAAIIAEDNRTVGIALTEWDLTKEASGLIFNIEDLAGQAVYGLTNQFFLVPRAIFVLVWRVLPKMATHQATFE